MRFCLFPFIVSQSLMELEEDAKVAAETIGSTGSLVVSRCTFTFDGFTLGSLNGPYLRSLFHNENRPALLHLSEKLWLFMKENRWSIGYRSENTLVRARQVEPTKTLNIGVEMWEENMAVFTERAQWETRSINISGCLAVAKEKDEDCIEKNRERHVGQVASCGPCYVGYMGDTVPANTTCTVDSEASLSLAGNRRPCGKLTMNGFDFQQWMNSRAFFLQPFSFPASPFVYKTRVFRTSGGDFEGLLYFCESKDAWHITAMREKDKMQTGGSVVEGYQKMMWSEKCYMRHLNCERVEWEKPVYNLTNVTLDANYPAHEGVSCFEENSTENCMTSCENNISCASFQFLPVASSVSNKQDVRDRILSGSYCIHYNHRGVVHYAVREEEEYEDHFQARVDILKKCEETLYPTYNKIAWIRNGGFEQVPFGKEGNHISGIHLSKRGIEKWKTRGRVYIGANKGGILASNRGDYHVWMTNGGDYVEQTIYVPMDYRHMIVFSAAREKGNAAQIAVQVNGVEILNIAPDSDAFHTYHAFFGPEDLYAGFGNDTTNSSSPEVERTAAKTQEANATIGNNATSGNATSGNNATNENATNENATNENATNGNNATTANATASNATTSNDTTTSNETTTSNVTSNATSNTSEDEALPFGMVRIRFLHSGVGAGNLLLDHISISSEDATIGGHYDEIANGDCPFFAMSAERHPTLGNYFEANRTDLWSGNIQAKDEEDAFLSIPPSSLVKVKNMSLVCDYGKEARVSTVGVCEIQEFWSPSCGPFLIALGSLGGAIFLFMLCFCYCIRSRGMSDEDIALDIKIGTLAPTDPRCPANMRAVSSEQVLTMSKFGRVHPQHQLLPYQIERISDQTEDARQAQAREGRPYAGAVRRFFQRLISGPYRVETVPTPVVQYPEVSSKSKNKIGAINESLTRYHTATYVDGVTEKKPHGRLDRSYRMRNIRRDAGRNVEIRDDDRMTQMEEVHWCSPVMLDLDTTCILSGLGDSRVFFTLSSIKSGWFGEQVVGEIKRDGATLYTVKEVTKRGKTNSLTKIYKSGCNFLGEIDSPQKHVVRCRDRVRTISSVTGNKHTEADTMFSRNKATNRVEFFSFCDDDGNERGTLELVSMREKKKWAAKSAVIDMSASGDRELDILMAFGFVFGIAYQSNFPPIRGFPKEAG